MTADGSMTEALIDVDLLRAVHGAPDLAVVDCRHVMGQAQAGRNAYLEAHIPGAVFVDLEVCLSGPASSDHGRHPLPPAARMAELFSTLGIDVGTRVVAYDDGGGMVAARLWWMLRYLGHERVAVLNGGWQCWVASGAAVASGSETRQRRGFRGEPRRARLITLAEIEPAMVLLDAREGRRFRGEFEPLDQQAGHIPGARNHFWQSNLGPDARFLPAVALREQLTRSLGILPDAATVHYCGSGVSACHNILAQVLAGLPEPRLYCGSWSEWSRTAGSAIAIGGES